MNEDASTRVFPVRGRPVGYQPGRWGGSLVAVERGYFPVSDTGYRSIAANESPVVTAELLEALAVQQDRERKNVLTRAQAPIELQRDRLGSYIHVSMSAERAMQAGFFAPDADRQSLWAAAHRLFATIDTDVRFQPDTTAPVWTSEYCVKALTQTREAMRMLERCARGDFPAEVAPVYISARAYLRLPARTEGEPTISLAPVASELALGTGEHAAKGLFRSARPKNPSVSAPANYPPQLDLFDDSPARPEPRRHPGVST